MILALFQVPEEGNPFVSLSDFPSNTPNKIFHTRLKEAETEKNS
ncbi:hypothetical protein STRDD13_00041 [Streptococcus sp. DD13]|nr:hypothetical protein STRDD13_00041 [Streptococcus sp. DD13]